MKLPPDRTVFSVFSGALLSLGGHATSHADAPHGDLPAMRLGDVEIGIFTGGSTFVGHGTVIDGAARLVVRRGVTGLVTLFVSVAGEIHGVVEAVVGDHGAVDVIARGTFLDPQVYLEPFGARSAEVQVSDVLDLDAAHRWTTGLALQGVAGESCSARAYSGGGDGD